MTLTQPTAGRSRRWVICADDFALDRGSIEATLALIERGRVNATSVLVDAPDWSAAARELKPLTGRADIGLHLNLTQPMGINRATWPLPYLLLQSQLRVAPRWRIRHEIERQLEEFTSEMGRAPDFVDGHQHVHQFPVVRDQLMQCLFELELKAPPWIRICRPPMPVRDRKARLIGALGAEATFQAARSAGLATSPWLVGVYGFDLKRDAYLERVRQWLESGPDGSVFMCHPSSKVSSKDPIGAARRMELGVLVGEQFSAAMAAARVKMARGSEMYRRPTQ
jgi:chitin disaccharide deacetylase